MINCKNKNTWLYYYNILYYIINIIYYIIKYIIILFFKRYQKIRKILKIYNQNMIFKIYISIIVYWIVVFNNNSYIDILCKIL